MWNVPEHVRWRVQHTIERRCNVATALLHVQSILFSYLHTCTIEEGRPKLRAIAASGIEADTSTRTVALCMNSNKHDILSTLRKRCQPLEVSHGILQAVPNVLGCLLEDASKIITYHMKLSICVTMVAIIEQALRLHMAQTNIKVWSTS